jgi:hypothetical protein
VASVSTIYYSLSCWLVEQPFLLLNLVTMFVVNCQGLALTHLLIFSVCCALHSDCIDRRRNFATADPNGKSFSHPFYFLLSCIHIPDLFLYLCMQLSTLFMGITAHFLTWKWEIFVLHMCRLLYFFYVNVDCSILLLVTFRLVFLILGLVWMLMYLVQLTCVGMGLNFTPTCVLVGERGGF